MSDCCTPYTPPACSPRRCAKLIDSCCVINEDNLPCLYPPVYASGEILEDSKYITSIGFAASGDVITDIEAGMTAFFGGDAVGEVTSSSGTTVVLKSASLVTASGDFVFKFIEQSQCDINKRIDEVLCGMKPCVNEYTPIELEVKWTPVQGYATASAAVTECWVRLRGSATAVDTLTSGDTIASGLPIPTGNIVLSVTITYVDGGQYFLPGLLVIDTSGVMKIYADFPVRGVTYYVSFDGMGYDPA